MGGLQVDERGNLANWAAPGKPLLGVGGAMDLASGAREANHHDAALQSRWIAEDPASMQLAHDSGNGGRPAD